VVFKAHLSIRIASTTLSVDRKSEGSRVYLLGVLPAVLRWPQSRRRQEKTRTRSYQKRLMMIKLSGEQYLDISASNWPPRPSSTLTIDSITSSLPHRGSERCFHLSAELLRADRCDVGGLLRESMAIPLRRGLAVSAKQSLHLDIISQFNGPQISTYPVSSSKGLLHHDDGMEPVPLTRNDPKMF
jgi:hypothetical protein